MTEASREIEVPTGHTVRISVTPDMTERRHRYNVEDAKLDLKPWAWIAGTAFVISLIGIFGFLFTTILMCLTSWDYPPAENMTVTVWIASFFMMIFGPIAFAVNAPQYFKHRKNVIREQRTYDDYLTDKHLSG